MMSLEQLALNAARMGLVLDNPGSWSTLRRDILESIAEAGPPGTTAQEAARLESTKRANGIVRDFEAKGLVRRAGTRQVNKCGRPSAVWVATAAGLEVARRSCNDTLGVVASTESTKLRAIEMMRAGRGPRATARECGCSLASLRKWGNEQGMPHRLCRPAAWVQWQVRARAAEGWAHGRIAAHVGVTVRHVRQVLSVPTQRPWRQFVPRPGLPQPGSAPDGAVAEAHGFHRSTVAAYRYRHNIPAYEAPR